MNFIIGIDRTGGFLKSHRMYSNKELISYTRARTHTHTHIHTHRHTHVHTHTHKHTVHSNPVIFYSLRA